jgi:uncharacterized protein YjbI with pentapeptide repeats
MKIEENGKVTFDPSSPESVAGLMRYLAANDLLKGADLSNANLSGANIKDSFLAGADFTGSNLGGSIFTNANLDGSCFENAFMCWVNFVGTDLRDARIARSELGQLDIVEDEY